ncbi:MAG: SMP-30/gluconolactonase/LRE family protein [Phycisphaeraceae bacterium]|nr:SMP-30/gluconolactonase/LRE family protein [Phycisphaeraceae bacterium]
MRMLTVVALLAAASSALAQPEGAPAGRLIAVDSSRSLWEINISTGSKVQIGTVSSNAGTTAGLAYDCSTGTVYLTSTSTDSLYTLDLATGAATLVGAYDPAVPNIVMHGIEWDSSTGTLYTASSHNNGLYSVNTTTGAATLIGTSGLTSFPNLVYDSRNNVMYGTSSGTDSFYQIDRATGAATLIGPLTGPTNPNGLAYNRDNDTIYMVDNNTDNLYTINRQTGQATIVGSTAGASGNNLLGLVYIPATPGCGGSTGCNAADIATEGSTQPFIDGPDGFITGTDFDVFVQAFFQEVRRPEPNGPYIADLTNGDGTGGPDGFITGSDFDFFIEKFFEGCPI